MSFLNEFQETFALSVASNLGAGSLTITDNKRESLTVQAETAVTQRINSLLPFLLTPLNVAVVGKWELVWGPGVYVAPKDIVATKNKDEYEIAATNVVLVAKKTVNNVATDYVVAVAGTNGASRFDVAVEDGEVIKLDKWAYGDDGKKDVKISNGTSKALSTLFNQLTSDDIPLQSYLAAISDTNVNITFTGHSLAGGLVPAIALALFNDHATVNPSLPKKKAALKWNVRTMPTAGPDIGNQDYVNFLKEVFPPVVPSNLDQNMPEIWQAWNAKLWNSLDVVPQVWSNEYIKMIPIIYGDKLATPKYVDCVIRTAKSGIELFNGGHNPYAAMDPGSANQMAGTFIKPDQIPGNDCKSNCSELPDGLCDFVAEMLYQHITAYAVGFGLPQAIANFFHLPGICKSAKKLYDQNIAGCK